MILITGGAGFIGSNLQAALSALGHQTAVADLLRDGTKWRNLRHHPPAEIIPPEDLLAWLKTAPRLDAIVHLGAISATTATDGDLVWRSNVTLSQALWRQCAASATPFIYASSAATYGDGAEGFEDDADLAVLSRLKPLNLYGWSKHAFDLWVARQLASGQPRPPQWAGLKFFNVYGPNEYHKAGMVSVIKVKHDEVAAGGPAKLFRSDRPETADGAQQRDFIFVDDVVEAMLFLLATPSVNGLFNLGTGAARSYTDLALAVCAANDVPERIEFIEMPASLRGQYQSFTQAAMHRLRAAGFSKPPLGLEEGVRRYVQEFLRQPDQYK